MQYDIGSLINVVSSVVGNYKQLFQVQLYRAFLPQIYNILPHVSDWDGIKIWNKKNTHLTGLRNAGKAKPEQTGAHRKWLTSYYNNRSAYRAN